MKIRDAIDIVKIIREHIDSPTKEVREGLAITALTGAIEALEKQLPKKPEEEKDAYTHKIGEFRVGKCPNCLAEVSDRFGVCVDCGQNVDWSVENE